VCNSIDHLDKSETVLRIIGIYYTVQQGPSTYKLVTYSHSHSVKRQLIVKVGILWKFSDFVLELLSSMDN